MPAAKVAGRSNYSSHLTLILTNNIKVFQEQGPHYATDSNKTNCQHLPAISQSNFMKICLYSPLIASLFCWLNNILYKETPSLQIYCTVFLELSNHCAMAAVPGRIREKSQKDCRSFGLIIFLAPMDILAIKMPRTLLEKAIF